MNMIITGGYGSNTNIEYADIDWSKSKHDILFKTDSTSINFKIDYFSTKFQLNNYNINFSTEYNDLKFNINTYNINFKANCK